MLEYDRIDISEGIDINKTNGSKERDIYHYWYLLSKNFSYKLYLCNVCHNLKQKAMNLNDAAIVSVKGSDYRLHFWYISKNDAISIMNNSNLNSKRGALQFFLLCIKLSEKTYNQKNRHVIYYMEQKIIMKMIKKDLKSKQEINTEIYLKKKKIPYHMEKKDIICQKKKKEKLKEYQRNYPKNDMKNGKNVIKML